MTLIAQFPFEVDQLSSGKRIDKFLSDLTLGLSRVQIADLIQKGTILVNERIVKSSYKLKSGDIVSFSQKYKNSKKKTEEVVAYSGPPIEILFEDEYFLIINKPEGLVVHPGSGIAAHETLYGWFNAFSKHSTTHEWPEELAKDQREGIVHRLDRGTSGVLILAKDPKTHQVLSEMFKLRKINRFYWAIVDGDLMNRLDKRVSKVDAYLSKGWAALKKRASGIWSIATFHGRDPNNPLRYRVEKEGRKAVSHFYCRSNKEKHSFVELKLATGRTHQIRVHMAFLGCPILGDLTYGGQESSRIFLHAYRIHFQHPFTEATISVDAGSRSFESYSKILGYRPQDYRLNPVLISEEL